jgi:hypothetical protein
LGVRFYFIFLNNLFWLCREIFLELPKHLLKFFEFVFTFKKKKLSSSA